MALPTRLKNNNVAAQFPLLKHIKEYGVTLETKDMNKDILGEVSVGHILLNKSYDSKADLRFVIAVLFIMEQNKEYGVLDTGFKYNGELYQRLVEASELILPDSLFESGKLITYKGQMVSIDLINFRRHMRMSI